MRWTAAPHREVWLFELTFQSTARPAGAAPAVHTRASTCVNKYLRRCGKKRRGSRKRGGWRRGAGGGGQPSITNISSHTVYSSRRYRLPAPGPFCGGGWEWRAARSLRDVAEVCCGLCLWHTLCQSAWNEPPTRYWESKKKGKLIHFQKDLSLWPSLCVAEELARYRMGLTFSGAVDLVKRRAGNAFMRTPLMTGVAGGRCRAVRWVGWFDRNQEATVQHAHRCDTLCECVCVCVCVCVCGRARVCVCSLK